MTAINWLFWTPHLASFNDNYFQYTETIEFHLQGGEL